MSRSTVLRGVAVGLALVGGAIAGTAVGSASGEWGCAPDRIAHSVYTPAEGGGSSTPDDAARRAASELAQDGPRTEDEYAAAFASRSGPTRYEPATGKVFVEGRVYARIAVARLGDGTWTIDNMTLCHRPPPPGASPEPTPGT